METKEYFEKVMQDYNQHRNGRSLRKYCKDEAVDYEWLLGFKKNYPSLECQHPVSSDIGFIPLLVSDNQSSVKKWIVERLELKSPDGDTIEIKSSNLFVVADLLHKMS